MTEAAGEITLAKRWEQRIGDLTRQRDEISSLVTPRTWQGKAWLRICNRMPLIGRLPFLPHVAEPRPVQDLTAEARDATIGIYLDITGLLRERGGIVNFYDDLSGLVEDVRRQPGNQQLVERLRQMVDRKADEGLRNFPRDSETDRFLAEVVRAQGPEQFREETLEDAGQLVAVVQPVAQVVQLTLVAGARLLRAQTTNYAILREVGPSVDLLHQSSGTMLQAAKNIQVTPELIIQQLNLSVQTAQLALEVAQLGGKFDEATDMPRLRAVSQEAQQLLLKAQASQLLQLNPAPKEEHD